MFLFKGGPPPLNKLAVWWLCWRCSHATLVFDIMLDQYGIWLGISTLIRGDTERLSQRLHPYAVPLIREAVKLGCIPTSLETVSLSLLSFCLSHSLSPPLLHPPLSLSFSQLIPLKHFSHIAGEDGTTNVALIGSHHLHAARSFFPFQLRLLFIFFRCICRDGLEIPQASISHMWRLPVGFFGWQLRLYLRGCFFSLFIQIFKHLEANLITPVKMETYL